MADGLSLRKFGKRLDVSGEAVRKAIATGKIPADCVGETRRGNKIDPCIIDPERAAEHWGRNRDPNQVRDKATLAAGAKRARAERRGEAPPPEDNQDDGLDEPQAVTPLDRAAGVTAASNSGPSASDYRKITEGYKARTAKVEFERLIGKLVDADVIKVFHVGLMTALRNRIMGVPSEAKGRIPHLSIDEIEILEELIAQALEDVADDDDD